MPFPILFGLIVFIVVFLGIFFMSNDKDIGDAILAFIFSAAVGAFFVMPGIWICIGFQHQTTKTFEQEYKVYKYEHSDGHFIVAKNNDAINLEALFKVSIPDDAFVKSYTIENGLMGCTGMDTRSYELVTLGKDKVE